MKKSTILIITTLAVGFVGFQFLMYGDLKARLSKKCYDVSSMNANGIADEMMFLATNPPKENETLEEYKTTFHNTHYIYFNHFSEDHFTFDYPNVDSKTDRIMDFHFYGYSTNQYEDKNVTFYSSQPHKVGTVDAFIYDEDKAYAVFDELCSRIKIEGYGEEGIWFEEEPLCKTMFVKCAPGTFPDNDAYIAVEIVHIIYESLEPMENGELPLLDNPYYMIDLAVLLE